MYSISAFLISKTDDNVFLIVLSELKQVVIIDNNFLFFIINILKVLCKKNNCNKYWYHWKRRRYSVTKGKKA